MGGWNHDFIEVKGKILPDINGPGIHPKYVRKPGYSCWFIINYKISLS